MERQAEKYMGRQAEKTVITRKR